MSALFHLRRMSQICRNAFKGTDLFRISLFSFIAALTMAAPGSQAQDFPETLRPYIFAEQKLIGDRNTNNDTLDNFYVPEFGNVFPVNAYWLDADKVEFLFDAKSAPKFVKSTYFKTIDGKKKVLFPVHPEAESFYQDITRGQQQGPNFTSTPSASSRTLFSFPEGQPNNLIFNKLSLNATLGGNVRLIHQVELARSFYVTRLLEMSKDTLPKSFDYYSEFLVMIPKGWDKGGVIVRSLPQEVANGSVKHLPFFSLFARRPDGKKPLLLKMAETKKQPLSEYFREHITRPFLRQWLDLALDHGITMEPHGQNLVLELNQKNQPTGRFIHRDFGGFAVDTTYRKRIGLKSPKAPTINGYTATYDDGDNGYAVGTSLDLYFGNITGNLGFQYQEWLRKGWVSEQLSENFFNDMTREVLVEVYKEKTGKDIDLNGHVKNIKEIIFEARGHVVIRDQAQNTCGAILK